MRPRLLIATALVAAICTLSACSSSTSSGKAGTTKTGAKQSGSSGTSLTVGMGAGVFTAPMATNSFNAAGFTINQKTISSGAVAVPLLLNGQLQFSEADSVGALTAISKGVPLAIVGAVTSGGTTPATDNTGVLVKPNGSIRSAADLNGKKVAVNAIGGSAQLAAAAAIDKLGGDSAKVKFIELPPPAMVPAVQRGTVDAAVTTAIDGQVVGLRVLISPLAEGLPSAPLIVWITSQKYLAQHRDIVTKFAKATAAADTYLNAHPELIRQITVKTSTTKVDPALTKKLVLAQFTPVTVQKSQLQKVVDVMKKYKVITSSIDLGKTLFTP